MCTYNTITSHTYHFEIQKRDSEESLLTFVNLFPSLTNSIANVAKHLHKGWAVHLILKISA